MPGSPLGASTEEISQSYCSNCSCASAMLVASEVRPQFGQKCSLVAGFHLMTACFIVSVKRDGSRMSGIINNKRRTAPDQVFDAG